MYIGGFKKCFKDNKTKNPKFPWNVKKIENTYLEIERNGKLHE